MFDEFFVNGDKPYAENLNDAVLLANALEFDVVVSAPEQFSTGSFLDSTSARKCGVCTMRLSESLPESVTVTPEGYLSFTDESSIDFFVYPNFNQFGNWKSIDWVCTDSEEENITIDLLTKSEDVIASNIEKGEALPSDVELKKLDEVIVRINSVSDVVLEKLEFKFGKRNNITIAANSVRIVGYSTTEEVVEMLHEKLVEVFAGKTATVTVEDGKLKVETFDEADL